MSLQALRINIFTPFCIFSLQIDFHIGQFCVMRRTTLRSHLDIPMKMLCTSHCEDTIFGVLPHLLIFSTLAIK